MRRIFLYGLGTVVVLVAVVAIGLRVPAIQDVVLERGVNAVVSSDQVDLSDPDSLTLIFCGTGGPFPDPERAGPCTLVAAGGRVFLVDSGTGGAQRLQQLRVPMGQIEGVLYTHLHSDHIAGLGDVAMNSWAGGRTSPLELYGPPGVEGLANGTFPLLGSTANLGLTITAKKFLHLKPRRLTRLPSSCPVVMRLSLLSKMVI